MVSVFLGQNQNDCYYQKSMSEQASLLLCSCLKGGTVMVPGFNNITLAERTRLRRTAQIDLCHTMQGIAYKPEMECSPCVPSKN